MSRKAALFTQAEINRVGIWAKKHGLKALIIDMPSGVKITVPLDKDFNVNNIEPMENTKPIDEKYKNLTI
ncbi:hypothetical protein [Bartonella apis]|uniref:hypothetical protein n=1 Tax=Bartonella apis TaxID=1686310 RepID=UPI002430F770|nr:hypothetical protein [Bartonella apis]